MENISITNNKRAYQYEASLPDGTTATLTYRWLKGDMLLMQTTIPPAARDTGLSDALITHVLNHARTHNLRIRVYCPLVTAFMKENDTYKDILA